MKKPLILLHGALGASEQFEPWKAALADDFELHTLDFEGHGNAPTDRLFRIAHFAENLVAFVRANELEGAAVFGYSMGGYVALYTARHEPGLLGDIFTFASKLAWNPESSRKEAGMLNADKIAEKVPHFAETLEARHRALGWREHLSRTAEMMLALGEQPALTEADWPQIEGRVRMGIGDRDNMVTLEETVAAARALPQGELLVLPGTKHPIEAIAVEAIAWQIRDFVG